MTELKRRIVSGDSLTPSSPVPVATGYRGHGGVASAAPRATAS